MTRQPVTSSAVKSVGFDPETGVLEAEFASGSVYTYHGVSQAHFEDLLKADSFGKHFSQFIKGGGFTAIKVARDPDE